jgi:hypothetical protein
MPFISGWNARAWFHPLRLCCPNRNGGSSVWGIHTKQSIAGDGHHIDHGGLLFHGNYCGLGSRQGARLVDALDVPVCVTMPAGVSKPSAGYSILASITAAVSGHDERQGAYL